MSWLNLHEDLAEEFSHLVNIPKGLGHLRLDNATALESKVRDTVKNWKAANPEKVREQKRRARERKAALKGK